MSARKPKLPSQEPADAPLPAEAEAGGILTIDLDAIVANWRALGRLARRPNAPPWSRRDAYGCGIEQVTPALGKAGCGTFFVAQLGEARRVRAVAPDATIYVLNGLPPGTAAIFAGLQSAPGHQQPERACRVGCLRRRQRLARRRGLARRYRHEPARHLARRSRRRRSAFARRSVRHHPGDEPLRPGGERRRSAQRRADAAFSRHPRAVPRRPGLARQFVRHLSRRIRPLRSRAAGRRALRRQPDARPQATRCARWSRLKGRIVQVRDVARGERRRLRRELDARSGRPASPSSRSAMPTAICAPAAPSDQRSGSEAVVAGQRCPIVGRISMDLLTLDVTDLPEGAVRRGDFVDHDRRRNRASTMSPNASAPSATRS